MNFTVVKFAGSNVSNVPECDVAFELLPVKNYSDDEAHSMIKKFIEDRFQMMFACGGVAAFETLGDSHTSPKTNH